MNAGVNRVVAESELCGVKVGCSDVAHADPAESIGASDDAGLTFAEWACAVEEHGDDRDVGLSARLVCLVDRTGRRRCV